MGNRHQKSSFSPEILENPRVNNNIVRRKIFDGIDSPELTLKLWMNLVDYPNFLNAQTLKSHPNYQQLIHKNSSYTEIIQKDIPRTFPEQKYSQLPQNKFMLQRVLVALSNRFPEFGYVSGMSFYAIRVLQITAEQKGYYILAWLYLNDPVIYNIACGKQVVPNFIEVVNELVDKECPELGAILKHVNISIGMFCVAWIGSLFCLFCDKSMFYTIFSLALLQGPKIWLLATIALVKCMEQPIMKSNRSDGKIIEITSSKDYLINAQAKQKFLCSLEQMIETYKHQIDSYLHRITNIVPFVPLDKQSIIINSKFEKKESDEKIEPSSNGK